MRPSLVLSEQAEPGFGTLASTRKGKQGRTQFRSALA